MRKYFNGWTVLGAGLAFLVWLAAVPSSTVAGIIQAVIPQVVPTANKRGNATVFQLANNNSAASAGTLFCDDGSGNATTSGCSTGGTTATITVANAASTGTTTSTLTKLTGAPSTAVIATAGDTGGVVGVTTAGAGTVGNATIQIAGSVSCVFDGATTAGDYVQISATTAGNCHDAGATYPTSGQVAGRVLSTNGAGGTFTIDLFPAEIKGASGGGGSPGGSATQWQYNNSTFAGLVGTSAIPQTGWSIINCGSQCAYSDFSSAFQSLMIFDNGTTNWRLVTRSLPASNSYTAIATINCLGVIPQNSQTCGLYISDGTKLEGVEVLSANGAGLEYQLRVQKMNTTSSDAGTLAGPTGKIISNPATLKIVGDATHRTFFYWSNGAYVQFFQEPIATFLTETTVGFGGLSNAGNNWINPQLLYWSLTNP